MQFLVDILPLGSGSVDPHIFADPDPGSQNLADPTDPDPKHYYKVPSLDLKNIVYFALSKLPSLSSVLNVTKSCFPPHLNFVRWKPTYKLVLVYFMHLLFYLNIWRLEKFSFCLFQALIWVKDFFTVFSTYPSTVSNSKNNSIFETQRYPQRMRL